jgi:hypothetical protein
MMGEEQKEISRSIQKIVNNNLSETVPSRVCILDFFPNKIAQ